MMRCFLKLKKSGLKPKNDALKTKGNAKKVTLKIHSLAKFTALKYLRRTQNVTRRPGRATATSPGQSDQGERHPGCEAHPERTPLEGAKAHSICFFAFALTERNPCGRVTQGVGSLPPLGRTVRMDSFSVKMFRSSDVLKFRSSEEGF